MNTIYMNVQKNKTVGDVVTNLQFQVSLDGEENIDAIKDRYNFESARIDTILNQQS